MVREMRYVELIHCAETFGRRRSDNVRSGGPYEKKSDLLSVESWYLRGL